MDAPALDIIAIGRSSVDLYGQQIGGRLEDMASFAKSVGGCPANIAIGAARLGLRAGLITRVGDEPLGRFIREQMAREGVSTQGIRTDPRRLTALVVLGVRDDRTFPLVFYRENCADAALDEGDIDEDFVASARAIVVTGTHFSRPNTAAAQRKAIRIAKANGRRVCFDIDYRPNLWGLAGHGAGEERYVRSGMVTAHLQAVLPDCDLIVGTEEELHIAGGSEDTLAALRAVRGLSRATIICKRGPMGCVVFPDAIPSSLEDGIRGPGFPVEVYNVLGAGDGFMAGFLRGWLGGESLERACTYANACGAIVVSRLLCSPEMPTFAELDHFLRHGSSERGLRRDKALAHLHHATTRRPAPAELMVLAVGEGLAATPGDAAPGRTPAAFQKLAVAAVGRVAAGRPGFGVLFADAVAPDALFRAADHSLWIGRGIESEGSRDIGARLIEWPVGHTVVGGWRNRPDDAALGEDRSPQILQRAFDAARAVGREIMIGVGIDPAADTTRALGRLYDLGLRPDWWALAARSSPEAWAAAGAAIAAGDPHCRGILAVAPDGAPDEIAAVARRSLVRGFIAGPAMLAAAAAAWRRGKIDDAAAVAAIGEGFARSCVAWRAARENLAGS